MAKRQNTAPAQKDKVDTTSNTDNVEKDDTMPTKDEDDIASNIVYVAKRPLLHGGKPYKVGEDVTGFFSEDEADRLLKMGVIEEA